MHDDVRAPPPETCLRVGILGPLEVTFKGRCVEIHGPKRRALLALLAVNGGRVVSMHTLVDELWLGTPPAGATATLQSHVSHLRHDLGDVGECMTTHPAGYQLAVGPDVIDSPRFERLIVRALHLDDPSDMSDALSSALALWRGRPLMEFEGATWARQEAERLGALWRLAVERRVDAELALDRHAELVPELQALVERHEFHEPYWLQLMRALDGCGRHVEALRAGRRLRSLLVEVGVTPSRDVEALESSILRRRHVHRRPESRLRPRVDRAAVQRAPYQTPRFVGRARERSTLCAALHEAATGRTQIVLIEGEPGAGKSRLVAETVADAEDLGLIALTGTCDGYLHAAFQPIADALRAALDSDSLQDGDFLSELPPPLARLLPDDSVGSAPAELADSWESDDGQYRLHCTFARWLSRLTSQSPVLLVIEDVQWAEPSTLLLLRHIVRSSEHDRLCIVLTYRATELAGAGTAAQAFSDMRRTRGLVELPLQGLAADDVYQLLLDWESRERRSAGWITFADAEALHEATAGNPLFACEILKHVGCSNVVPPHRNLSFADAMRDVGVPARMNALVWPRMSSMSSETVSALEGASILGNTFSAPLLGRIMHLDDDRLTLVLEEAEAAGFILPVATDDLTYRYCHTVVQDTVQQRISTVRRALLHRRAVEAYEASQASANRNLARIARHCVGAGGTLDARTALRYCWEAGHQALHQRAPDTAAAHYRDALRILERCPDAEVEVQCELTLNLGEAERLSKAADHRSTFLVAAELARSTSDRDRLARAGKGISRSFLAVSGPPDKARRRVLEAGIAAYGSEPTGQRALLLSSLAGEERFQGEYERSSELASEAVDVARRAGNSRELFATLATRWDVIFHPASLIARIDLSREMLKVARQAGDATMHVRALWHAFCCSLERGRGDEARLRVNEMDRLAAQADSGTIHYRTAVVRATMELIRGRLEEAECQARSARDLGRDVGISEADLVYAAHHVQLKSLQLRLDELDSFTHNLDPVMPSVRAVCALASLRRGDSHNSEAVSSFCRQVDDGLPPPDVTWPFTIAITAQIMATLGDGDRAASLERSLIHRRHQFLAHPSYFLGPVTHLLGLLRYAQGDVAAADDWLHQAEGALARMEAPAHLAVTRLDHCRMLRAGKDRWCRETASTLARRGARDAREAGLVYSAEAFVDLA